MSENIAFHKLSVIVTTQNDAHYQEDLRNLNEINLNVAHRFSSGNAALDYIRFNPTHLIVTDIELRDMNVQEFIKSVNQQHRTRPVPVVVVSDTSSEDFVLDSISAGCSGFVVRPYTTETLKNHLVEVVKLDQLVEIDESVYEMAREKISQGEYDGAIADLQEIVENEENEADVYFQQGMQYLWEKKYGKAIVAFKKALQINGLYIKAYTGLAEAYKGKGDYENYKHYLQMAADEYARLDEFEEVRSLFTEILKCDPNAPNPYNTLGINLRKQGKYEQAKVAYKQALDLAPDDENVHYNMAKSYYFASELDAAIRYLTNALSINAGFDEARKLYEKLTGQEWTGSAARDEPGQGSGR
jgi:tetratricopeptide (TPR) repeat protein